VTLGHHEPEADLRQSRPPPRSSEGGGGTSSKDLPIAPASGADIGVSEEAALCSEVSPPPFGSVGLSPGLSGLGAEVAPPYSTIISLGPRDQIPAISFGSTELP
jgi:hypothetical protein